ncbi:MAG TPA: hypothetical protein DCY15_03530 [Ruminococcaceae bacterium]|nr:hypothetical protein [Oscillospiraceae bacterium]
MNPKQNGEGEKTLIRNMKAQVFLQFVLIFMVILCVILLTSTSLYTNIITGMTLSNLRDAVEDVKKVDVSQGEEVIRNVENIERKLSVFIEVYGKNPGDKENEYTQVIYSKYSYDRFYNRNFEKLQTQEPASFVGFKDGNFDIDRDYADGSCIGKLTNPHNSYEFYVLASPGLTGAYQIVVAVPYSTIEQQARTVSITMGLIILLVFIAVSIVVYFYVTQITGPIKKITEITQRMAVEDDPNLRIPSGGKSVNTEVDASIESINAMYSSWMITKEKLAERSEFLLEQLHEKELEKKYREEFIAGTSHELKTPIAIIQGYAEGAKYSLDDKETVNEYCDTIIDECTRMNDLVVNMMSLSNIQQNSDSLNYEDFSITDFIADDLASHSIVFKKHGIKVENLIHEQIVGKADLKKLPFVINNLISNAISYIGGDPKIIRIRYEDVGLSYRIYVFNSGDNIPEDVLEKLWFSFYRHDAARMRNDGHFGLGLSIVKGIQDAHSEQCGVNNAEGGVEFWFDIGKGSLDNDNKKE